MFILLSFVIPFALSPAAYLLFKKREDLALYLTLSTYLLSFMLTLLAFILEARIEVYYEEVGSIIGFSLFVDELSVLFCFVTTAIFLCSTLFSKTYIKRRPNGYPIYYTLLLILYALIIGLYVSQNLLLLLLFYELSTLPIVLIIAKWGYREPVKVAIITLIFMMVGALLVAIGLTFIFSYANSLNMKLIVRNVSNLVPVFKASLSFILFGLFVKMPVFPIHYWLPLAYAEAPSPLSAVLSGVITGTSAYSMVRIIYLTLMKPSTKFFSPEDLSSLFIVTIAIAFASIIYSSIMALREFDVKRIIAFSSITHMNFTLLSFLAGAINMLYEAPSYAIAASSYHTLTHGLSKALWFLFAGSIIYLTEERDLLKLRGVLHTHANLYVIGITTLFAALPVPPFASFFSELLMLLTSFAPTYPFIQVPLVLGFLLSYGYVIRFLYFIWSKGETKVKVNDFLPTSMLASTMALIALTLAFGFLSFYFYDVLSSLLR